MKTTNKGREATLLSQVLAIYYLRSRLGGFKVFNKNMPKRASPSGKARYFVANSLFIS